MDLIGFGAPGQGPGSLDLGQEAPGGARRRQEAPGKRHQKQRGSKQEAKGREKGDKRRHKIQ